MGMTITEKILAEHSGLNEVKPGQLINTKLDIVLANDVTAPVAINEFEKVGAKKVYDKDKICLVPDHFAPNKDIKSAEQIKQMREFARLHDITNFFEMGKMGIEHCLLPEKGIVAPGDVIIGADSHTCTYGALGAFATGVGSTDMAAGMITGEAWFKVPEQLKFNFTGKLQKNVSGKDLILYVIGLIGVDGARYMSMEFTGETIRELSMDSRFTIANMAIEAGAKNGIIAPDDITREYIEGRVTKPFKFYASDSDATYKKVYEIDASKIEPQIAFPHLPENTKGISEVGEVKLDQVVIGSCTNGRIEDLAMAAAVLDGKKVHRDIRLLIFPGTQDIYLEAMKRGYVEIFIRAGGVVSTPTCGPCLGGHMGILAKGESALSTTNRNFVGRMGSPESFVYLSNPVIAAASAITGKISSPEEVE